MEILSTEKEKKKINLSFLKKARMAFAFVLWLLAMVLLVALFVMKKDQLKKNLEEAQVKERLFGKNEPLPIKTESEAAPIFSNTKQAQLDQSEAQLDQSEAQLNQSEAEPNLSDSLSQEAITDEITTENTEESEAAKVLLVDMAVYFATIDENGNVEITSVTRQIEKSDSPMMSALNAVISGVTAEEAERGLQSLIPEGSELLGATVADGVATLNFNDAFEYNNFGFQGSFYQLMQIVYTATEFPTVDSVQILINGEKQEYLGSEGVFIGSPLDRKSF